MKFRQNLQFLLEISNSFEKYKKFQETFLLTMFSILDSFQDYRI